MTGDQDGKSVAADLKKIYQAATESEALRELEAFQAKCEKKYPLIAKSWRANWARIKPMFELPAEIRRAIYTTNVIVLSWWYSFYKRTISCFPSLKCCNCVIVSA